MKIISFTVWLALLSLGSAIPLNEPAALVKREPGALAKRTQDTPPTIATIITWLRTQANWDGSNIVFWSYEGKGTDADYYAKNIIQGNSFNTLYYFDDPKSGNEVSMLTEWSNTNSENWKAVTLVMSEALAEHCTGIAYVMIPKNGAPQADSMWVQAEAKILKRRGITVHAVDPADDQVWNTNFLG
jgi:hypothetical protein